jgi:succinate dehydrogenase flavin-adding protein (antitoxin of CptAB toxin-antitoxin module)
MVTDKDLYAEVICRLAEDVGYDTLACILNVQTDDLFRWAAGKARPPAQTFFQIMKIANGGA